MNLSINSEFFINSSINSESNGKGIQKVIFDSEEKKMFMYRRR